MERQAILDRIDECETILKELEGSRIWAIITKDMERSQSFLDSNWQNVKSSDVDKRDELRIAKLAITHILNLPASYQKDLNDARNALNAIDNTDKEIPKDYDIETNIEKTKSEGGDYGSR